MNRKMFLLTTIFILFFGNTASFGQQSASEQAKRQFDRGMATVEMAKSPDDYAAAIKEFEQARSLAPGLPDVYYSLGMVQEKAEKYSDAVTSLKQYPRVAPNASEAKTVKTLINKLEYKAEQVPAVPDGFIGVSWGSSTDQIIKTMNERGYRQLTGTTPGTLAFRGAFAGTPCELHFSLLVNSFYRAWAFACARSDYPLAPQMTYRRIFDELNEKYGPPQTHESGKNKTNRGDELPYEFALWNLVDSRTSDKYTITIHFHVTWFTDKRGDQYVVDSEYVAESLYERLKKREY